MAYAPRRSASAPSRLRSLPAAGEIDLPYDILGDGIIFRLKTHRQRQATSATGFAPRTSVGSRIRSRSRTENTPFVQPIWISTDGRVGQARSSQRYLLCYLPCSLLLFIFAASCLGSSVVEIQFLRSVQRPQIQCEHLPTFYM